MAVEFSYSWNIENGGYNAINSQLGAVMHSEVFENSGCKFYMEFTPNGYPPMIPKEHACIWLAVKELPKDTSHLTIKVIASIDEIGYKDEKITKRFGFGPGCSYSTGLDKMIQTKAFEKLNNRDVTIDIQIIIQEFHAKSEEDNKAENLLNMLKMLADLEKNKKKEIDAQTKWEFKDANVILNAKKDAVLQSETFKHKDIELFIELTPNGYSKGQLAEKTVFFWLALKHLPKNIKCLDVEVIMKIDEIGYKDSRRHNKFGFGMGCAHSFGCLDKVLYQNNFKDINSFTFVCDIIIHDVIEKTKEDYLQDLLLAKMIMDANQKNPNKPAEDKQKQDQNQNGFLDLLVAMANDENKPVQKKDEKDEKDDKKEEDAENEDKKKLKKFILDNELTIDVYNKLIENEFDSIDSLLEECFDFTNDDWKEIGIKIAKRKKLLKALHKYKSENQKEGEQT